MDPPAPNVIFFYTTVRSPCWHTQRQITIGAHARSQDKQQNSSFFQKWGSNGRKSHEEGRTCMQILDKPVWFHLSSYLSMYLLIGSWWIGRLSNKAQQHTILKQCSQNRTDLVGVHASAGCVRQRWDVEGVRHQIFLSVHQVLQLLLVQEALEELAVAGAG